MTDSTLTTEAVGTAPSRRRVTIGLCSLVVAIAFEVISVATAMPVAARDLDGLQIYAWAFSLFLIGMLFATVVAGRWSDRTGPAGPLIAGIVVFTVGLVVSGTAPLMEVLITGRLIQGLGSGALNTATYVVIARIYPPDARPRMFTYISTAWILPSFVGPPVAAWLTQTLSWHWVFIAVIPLVAFGTVLVTPTLRHLIATARASVDAAAEERDGPGESDVRPAPLWAAALVALGAAALQYAGQRLDWWSLLPLVLGLAALVVALPRLMPTGFSRLSRGIVSVILARVFLAGGLAGSEAFVPLMLVEQRHLPLVLAGAVLTASSVGWFSGSWLQSQRWVRIPRERLITLGCLCLLVGLSLTGLTAAVPWFWVGLVPIGWVVTGLGMGLATASTSLAVMLLSRHEEVGRNASSLNLGDALGSGVFVGVSGTIFAALHPGGNTHLTFGLVFAASAVVALLAVLSSLRIGTVRNVVES